MTTGEAWQKFSFSEFLKPADGWRTKDAVFSTYSFDLSVVALALLALTGCELDYGKKGSRVELVKALDALRGKVRVVAQQARGTIPNAQLYVLKLLDRFVKTIELDESEGSWHPKVALCRYARLDDDSDQQWRLWVGSRNLVRAMNWEAGLGLISRGDGKGQTVEGLASLGRELTVRANLKALDPIQVESELGGLTWDCPAGTKVQKLALYGPGFKSGFPLKVQDARSVIVMSPFLSRTFVRAASKWGKPEADRTLVSTGFELQRLWTSNNKIFDGFRRLLTQPMPDLPGECAELLQEQNTVEAELLDGEESAPGGLHAKVFYAASGTQRQLVLGSANATSRAWDGSNYEAVAALIPSGAAVEGLEEFIEQCAPWSSNLPSVDIDEDEVALEMVRRSLGNWTLKQRASESEVEITAVVPPPVQDKFKLEIALMNGAWNLWPKAMTSVRLKGAFKDRSEFVQLRLSVNDKMSRWLQTTLCEPPPDDERDRAVIARYLDPRTFLLWLRSILANEPKEGGGDWDGKDIVYEPTKPTESHKDLSMVPTVEEILRSWARDPSTFKMADEKVSQYLNAFRDRAIELNDVNLNGLLEEFRATWDTLASELR